MFTLRKSSCATTLYRASLSPDKPLNKRSGQVGAHRAKATVVAFACTVRMPIYYEPFRRNFFSVQHYACSRYHERIAMLDQHKRSTRQRLRAIARTSRVLETNVCGTRAPFERILTGSVSGTQDACVTMEWISLAFRSPQPLKRGAVGMTARSERLSSALYGTPRRSWVRVLYLSISAELCSIYLLVKHRRLR